MPKRVGGWGGGGQQIESYKSAAAEVEAGEDMSYPVAHSSVGCLVKGGLFIDHQQESRFSVWRVESTSDKYLQYGILE